MKKTVVSILGATGLVGADVVTALASFQGELRLFASEDSAGEVYKVGMEEVVVQVPTKEALEGSDIILCCLPPEEAKRLLPLAVATEAVIIDNSGELRRAHPESVLSVPTVEHGVGNKKSKLFSLASPVTTQLAPVLFALSKISPLVSLRITALYAVSSAGRAGLDELWEQTKSVYTQTESPREVFSSQVAFNCVPYVGIIDDTTGNTSEEDRIASELRELLKTPKCTMHITAIRVPVFHSHSVNISVQTKDELSCEQVRATLEKIPGVVLHDAKESLPEPVGVAGEDTLHVGRIRRDAADKNATSLWLVADNIRYGAVNAMVEAVQQFIATEN